MRGSTEAEVRRHGHAAEYGWQADHVGMARNVLMILRDLQRLDWHVTALHVDDGRGFDLRGCGERLRV